MNVIISQIIRSFNNPNLKRIVNVYQLHYKNGPAQGFGDYLRGCFCLLQMSTLLGLEFDMDFKNHPMSKYLETTNSYDIPYSELIRYEDKNYIPISATEYKTDSISFFINFIKTLNALDCSNGKDTFYIFCHSFPIITNILPQGKQIIRSKIVPSSLMNSNIEIRLNRLGLTKHHFTVIHIRGGDEILLQGQNGMLGPRIKKLFQTLSYVIAAGPSKTYVILSDNNQIKMQIKSRFPNANIVTLFNKITHLGESVDQTDDSVMHTLLDFYMMGYASNIISFSPYTWGSGFSKWCSVIYDVPFQQVILQ